MLLIWSVLLGFFDLGYSICECCGWIVSELALSSRSAVAQVPSHFEKGFQHETKVVSHRVRARTGTKDVPNRKLDETRRHHRLLQSSTCDWWK